MLYFYTGSKQKHAFLFSPNKYSMFVSMIFSIIIIKDAWASIEKREKESGHMKVHKKCEDTFWSIVEQKKALLLHKGWRKNHCYEVIMIIQLPHTCTP
jgi:hypothetical protein